MSPAALQALIALTYVLQVLGLVLAVLALSYLIRLAALS